VTRRDTAAEEASQPTSTLNDPATPDRYNLQRRATSEVAVSHLLPAPVARRLRHLTQRNLKRTESMPAINHSAHDEPYFGSTKARRRRGGRSVNTEVMRMSLAQRRAMSVERALRLTRPEDSRADPVASSLGRLAADLRPRSSLDARDTGDEGMVAD